MGIRIAHEPVGAPILAAYSAGVGRAQNEIADRQSKMWQQQQAMKQRAALQRNQQGFVAEQNRLNRQNQANIAADNRQHDFDILDARNEQYRDKDRTDWIMGNIDARQKLVLGQELSPYGQEKWGELQRELDDIRKKASAGEYRPGEYNQFLSAWQNKFDSLYGESWKAPKPNPVGDIRDRGIYVMPDGSFMSAGEYIDRGMSGGTLHVPDARGNLQKLDGGGTDANKASEEWWKTYKQAQSEYKDKVSQIVPGSGVAIPDANTWIQRRMDELDEMRSGKKYTPPSGEMLDPNADLGSRGYKWVPETGQPNGGFWQPDGSAPAQAPSAESPMPTQRGTDSMSQVALPQQQGATAQAPPQGPAIRGDITVPPRQQVPPRDVSGNTLAPGETMTTWDDLAAGRGISNPAGNVKDSQTIPVPKLDDAGQAVLRDIGMRADDLLPPEQAQKVHEAEALIAQYGPNTLQWPEEVRIRFEQLMLLGGGK